MAKHECQIFREAGFKECPFKGLKEHEDDDRRPEFDDRLIPIASRKAKEAARPAELEDELLKMRALLHPDDVDQKMGDIAAIQVKGGMSFIPEVVQNREASPLVSSGRTRRGFIAALTAIAIGEALRRGAGKFTKTESQTGRVSQTRAARLLGGLGKATSPGQGGARRGGGSLFNAGQQLKADLGLAGGRRREREVGRFGFAAGSGPY